MMKGEVLKIQELTVPISENLQIMMIHGLCSSYKLGLGQDVSSV